MAKLGYAQGLTGGGANDLDSISASTMSDGDPTLVFTSDLVGLLYKYDGSDTSTEASPGRITPDDSTGPGRHRNVNFQAEKINALGTISATAQTIDLNLGRIVTGTLSTKCGFTFANIVASSLYIDGFIFYLKDGGSKSVFWPPQTRFDGGAGLSLSTSGWDTIVFLKKPDGTTTFDGFLTGLNMSTS